MSSVWCRGYDRLGGWHDAPRSDTRSFRPVFRSSLGPARQLGEVVSHAAQMLDRAPSGSALKKLSDFLYGNPQVFEKTKESIQSAFAQNRLSGVFFAVGKVIGLFAAAILNLISYVACFLGTLLVSTVMGIGMFVIVPLNIYLMTKSKRAEQVLEDATGQHQVYRFIFSYLTSAITRSCMGKSSQSGEPMRGLKHRLRAISSVSAHLGLSLTNPIFMLVQAIRHAHYR